MEWLKRFITYTLVFYVLVATVYWTYTRRVHLTWGASAEEQTARLPGDELISAKSIITTRAIDIDAPKEKVWPWIAQTGQNRGGFNSYHWLENLFGAQMPNEKVIHPEWQNPRQGDTVYFGKDMPYALVSGAKRNEYYSLQGWTYYLRTVTDTRTRLVIRYPSMEVQEDFLAGIFYYGLFEPLHFIMESGMMMGIKEKAEKHKDV